MTGPPDLKDLWRDQPTETPPMTLEQIHARGFQSNVRRRNMIEYVASAVVIATFGAYVVILPGPILKVASVLVILGALVMVMQLHRRASAQPTPPAADALAFHRAELVRQRDAIRSAWLWYLAPFAPGFALFTYGETLALGSAPLAMKLVVPAFTAAYVVAWFWINRRARRRLEARIAEIDALRRG